MSKFEVETTSDESGSIRVRLPAQAAGRRVRVIVEWASEEPDESVRRQAVFAELRRRGNPDVLRLLAERGEDAIRNPDALLFVGATADAPLAPPEELTFEQRDELL